MICEKIAEYQGVSSQVKRTLQDEKKGSGRSKYLIENPTGKPFFVIDFEKDIFEDSVTKCDFGLKVEHEGEKRIFFVELKGSDAGQGVKQLLSTLTETERCFQGFEKQARLVVSKFRSPDLVKRTIDYKQLSRKTNNNIIIKQHQIVELI